MTTADDLINEKCSLSYPDSRHLMRMNFGDSIEEPRFETEAKGFIRDCFGAVPKIGWKGMGKADERLVAGLNSHFTDNEEPFCVREVESHPGFFTIQRSS